MNGPARSLRVLLLEDHSDTAHQLTRLLQRAGHEVTWAGSIREARELIEATGDDPKARGFNILISDLGSPDGSGHDLMRDLARRHHLMPAIALSGYGMKDDILDRMAAGFPVTSPSRSIGRNQSSRFKNWRPTRSDLAVAKRPLTFIIAGGRPRAVVRCREGWLSPV